MAKVYVHIWKPGESGLPFYLCGIEADEVVASVAHSRINLFPREFFCGACIRMHEAQAESPALELNPFLLKGYLH